MYDVNFVEFCWYVYMHIITIYTFISIHHNCHEAIRDIQKQMQTSIQNWQYDVEII